jgi:hypothetical protein
LPKFRKKILASLHSFSESRSALATTFKDNNMQLFFFILTSFLALGSRHISINKDYSIPSVTHIDTTKGVIIQNSLPKGNGRLDSSGKNGYNDPAGKNFAYAIFWTRVTNETATPLPKLLHKIIFASGHHDT